MEEFAGRTRRPVYSVTELAGPAITDSTCEVLWTDPSGWLTIGNGHVRPASLHVPAGPLTRGGELIAW